MQWTVLGLGNHGFTNKNTMPSTWIEIALVCQIQTGIRFAPDHLDLKSQEAIFRTMVKKISSMSTFTVQGIKEKTKYVWRPVSASPSGKPLFDHSREGF